MATLNLPFQSPLGSAFDLLLGDNRGLVPVVTVEQSTGTVLMAAWLNLKNALPHS